jgi:mannitol/fructose-specific phosphotransferase system IIA component
MYLDPGFGSMVIQMAIGIAAAGGAALYVLRQKIAKLLGRSPEEDDVAEAEKQEELANKNVE